MVSNHELDRQRGTIHVCPTVYPIMQAMYSQAVSHSKGEPGIIFTMVSY